MNDLALVFKILENVLYKDKKSNEEINIAAHKAENLSYVSRLVYGVLENKIYLDYMIDKLSSVKLKKIHKNVLIILEMGFYNIHFLNTKDYATVDKLVDLTKTKNKRSAGFVNAILRNFIRNEDEISKIKISDDLKSLSVRYSMPLEISSYINEAYGMDYTKNFLRYVNTYQDLNIRVNKLKTIKEELKNSLEEKGYEIEESNISHNALKVKNPAGLVEDDLFTDGYFTVQNDASMKVVEVLDPKENTKVLDLCAAPGTKTSYIAEYTKNKADITANDLSEKKLALINQNINRLGLKNIKLLSFDGAVFNEHLTNAFDYVLVDAPCSGLGLMARKVEIRYNRTVDDIKNLASLQRKILDQAIRYIKPNGYLVFSTCTLGPLENKDNFNYLKAKDNLDLVNIDGKEYIEFVPFIDNTDGFFISKFRKK
ncbi:16S rRNA (cytosine(967)-C(5))-methyltransferase RsmB [Anaerococcus sp. AGMB09787]|uniref:16S rRNA (cytosine(967)-C(5))-methyltransferase RsmB n=1 Tax=Anaerococcus sp. AGMB09787 TaxID=2922869 RepID=UPI001FAECB82|nr:16S rRNA (cytosine(967)-C(5))-methyltransferase RsmB [Anaerococcus sp. AGMB09787]